MNRGAEHANYSCSGGRDCLLSVYYKLMPLGCTALCRPKRGLISQVNLVSWTATILGHDEEIYSTEAATEIPIC